MSLILRCHHVFFRAIVFSVNLSILYSGQEGLLHFLVVHGVPWFWAHIWIPIPIPHQEILLSGSVSRNLIQTLPHRGNYQTHDTLWLWYLGTKLVTNRLGSDGENSNLASQVHDPMQAYNFTAHYSGKVWCPTISPQGYLLHGPFLK